MPEIVTGRGPDLRGFNNLNLYDRDAQAIFDAAITLALTRLPDWIAREGNTEVVLLESTALEVSELTWAINRVPAAVTISLMRLFEIAPDFGAAPDLTVRVNAIDVNGYVIPAGTRFLWRGDALSDGYVVATTAPLVIANGTDTAVVAAMGIEPGVELHDAVAGAALEPLDSIAGLASATIETAPTGGRLAETTTEYVNRAIQKLRTLTTTLLLPRHFEAAAALDPAVYRVRVVDLYDPAVGPNPGDNPGHVTVAVLGEDGAPVSGADKAALEETMADQAAAHLEIHVVDVVVNDVDLAATVEYADGYDPLIVEANVRARLADYLNPNTWIWYQTVYGNEVVSVIDDVPGVVRVKGPVVFTGGVAQSTTEEAHLDLTGVAPVAKLGTATLTLQVEP